MVRVPKAPLLALVASVLGVVSVEAQLPNPGMRVDAGRTALVITDPQNDFLSPEGVTWGVVGESVTENNTVANIEALLKAAKQHGVPVFVSPHYYYPTDHGWQFAGALETLMHKIGMFGPEGALDLHGFAGSGSDWLEQYRRFIEDGKTVVTSPHKVYGPETNDLVLQLRKRGIDKVILAGMSANHSFTTRGRTTVQPTTHGSPAITHITGAIPLPGENGVMSGTGAFARFRASARLSGAVNLSRLESHGEITFDCIFVIDPL